MSILRPYIKHIGNLYQCGNFISILKYMYLHTGPMGRGSYILTVVCDNLVAQVQNVIAVRKRVLIKHSGWMDR